jgi:hypothetical protein
MPTKSIFDISGSYEVRTKKTDDVVELTLVLDKTWANQLGLDTNEFFIHEPNANMAQQEYWLEEKLWTNIREIAQPKKITDYYYPEEFFQKH